MHHTIATERRKVAVHCHAGLGRTGLVAACFLVYSGTAAGAPDAVLRVRSARPGALQTAAQVLFVSVFQQYLAHLRCVFGGVGVGGREGCAVVATPSEREGMLSRALRRAVSGASSGAGSGGAANALAACEALAALGGPSGAPAALAAATVIGAAPAPVPHEQQLPVPLGSVCSSTGGAGGASALPTTVDDAMRRAGSCAGGDAPLHVIATDAAVTEVYGDGLTIIRAAPSMRPERVDALVKGAPQVRCLRKGTACWSGLGAIWACAPCPKLRQVERDPTAHQAHPGPCFAVGYHVCTLILTLMRLRRRRRRCGKGAASWSCRTGPFPSCPGPRSSRFGLRTSQRTSLRQRRPQHTPKHSHASSGFCTASNAAAAGGCTGSCVRACAHWRRAQMRTQPWLTRRRASGSARLAAWLAARSGQALVCLAWGA